MDKEAYQDIKTTTPGLIGWASEKQEPDTAAAYVNLVPRLEACH